jgi:hypothetical protein
MKTAGMLATVGVVAATLGIGLSSPAHADNGAICEKGVVTMNDHTSCQFALNLVAANPNGQVGQFSVYSPTTGEIYLMTCNKLGSGVVCTGGNDAAVNLF